ncbi:hypothetical protein D3C85_1869270 [compost metagenome]
MPIFILHQTLQQLKAQLFARATARAGMRFVNNDALWCNCQKVFAMALALDVIEANHHHGIVIE